MVYWTVSAHAARLYTRNYTGRGPITIDAPPHACHTHYEPAAKTSPWTLSNHEPAVAMKTRFYDRTAYSLSSEPVPNCFLKLDDHFDSFLIERQQIPLTPLVLLAESVCGRMADVEMYAFLLEDVRKRKTLERDEDDRAAILTRSFLLGYISAARGLLDSSAVTLSTMYGLPLVQAEQQLLQRRLLASTRSPRACGPSSLSSVAPLLQ